MNRRDIEELRAILKLGAADATEQQDFVSYADKLEELLDEADQDDALGTEGWRHRLGLDE